MRPIAVLPIHDPDGVVLANLEAAGPYLKRLFGSAFVGLTAGTVSSQPVQVTQLHDDHFYQVVVHEKSLPVGDQFRDLFALAATAAASDQLLHLCFPDRLSFALSGRNRVAITADVTALEAGDVPLIFQRSQKAWQSHPANYRLLEGIVTEVGQLLFGQSLDFAWCHLVVTAGQLAAVLPCTSRQDMSVVAEIAIQLKDQIRTKDVDWLSWEDPFLYHRDPTELKAEREADPSEVRKRLSYVLPMLDVLYRAAAQQDL